ncbi:MAG: hypothetical protein ACPGC9_02260 [Cytophagales bacterium]
MSKLNHIKGVIILLLLAGAGGSLSLLMQPQGKIQVAEAIHPPQARQTSNVVPAEHNALHHSQQFLSHEQAGLSSTISKIFFSADQNKHYAITFGPLIVGILVLQSQTVVKCLKNIIGNGEPEDEISWCHKKTNLEETIEVFLTWMIPGLYLLWDNYRHVHQQGGVFYTNITGDKIRNGVYWPVSAGLSFVYTIFSHQVQRQLLGLKQNKKIRFDWSSVIRPFEIAIGYFLVHLLTVIWAGSMGLVTIKTATPRWYMKLYYLIKGLDSVYNMFFLPENFFYPVEKSGLHALLCGSSVIPFLGGMGVFIGYMILEYPQLQLQGIGCYMASSSLEIVERYLLHRNTMMVTDTICYTDGYNVTAAFMVVLWSMFKEEVGLGCYNFLLGSSA